MHSRSARSGQGTRLRDALPFLRKAYAFFRLRFASSTNDGGKQASVLTSAHSLLMGSCRAIQTGYWLHLTTKPRPPASSCLRRPRSARAPHGILRRGVLERPLGEVHVAAHYGLLSVGRAPWGAPSGHSTTRAPLVPASSRMELPRGQEKPRTSRGIVTGLVRL